MRTQRKPRSLRERDQVRAVGASFARSLDRVIVRAGTINYAEVVAGLRSLEKQYFGQLKEHPKFALELRRRIAEQLLAQAIFHGCELSVCRARLSAASRLGFTDVERSAHFRLLYAKGALDRGHRIAYRTASSIAQDLSRTLKRRRSPLAKDLLRLTGEFLDHIMELEPQR